MHYNMNVPYTGYLRHCFISFICIRDLRAIYVVCFVAVSLQNFAEKVNKFKKATNASVLIHET